MADDEACILTGGFSSAYLVSLYAQSILRRPDSVPSRTLSCWLTAMHVWRHGRRAPRAPAPRGLVPQERHGAPQLGRRADGGPRPRERAHPAPRRRHRVQQTRAPLLPRGPDPDASPQCESCCSGGRFRWPRTVGLGDGTGLPLCMWRPCASRAARTMSRSRGCIACPSCSRDACPTRSCMRGLSTLSSASSSGIRRSRFSRSPRVSGRQGGKVSCIMTSVSTSLTDVWS